MPELGWEIEREREREERRGREGGGVCEGRGGLLTNIVIFFRNHHNLCELN